MISEKRIREIGRFLNDRLVIHRNVEHNAPWTTEESMIKDLYDNFLNLLIEYQSIVNKNEIDKVQSCADMSRSMIGRRGGYVKWTESFRRDFDSKIAELADLQLTKAMEELKNL